MNGRRWPGAAVPEVCRKQTIKDSGGSAKGCYAAPAPTGGHQPPPAIHAPILSRRERLESRWSSHSSRSHARRAISKAARQGSVTTASMRSCSNGRGLANRIDAIDPEQQCAWPTSSRLDRGNVAPKHSREQPEWPARRPCYKFDQRSLRRSSERSRRRQGSGASSGIIFSCRDRARIPRLGPSMQTHAHDSSGVRTHCALAFAPSEITTFGGDRKGLIPIAS